MRHSLILLTVPLLALSLACGFVEEVDYTSDGGDAGTSEADTSSEADAPAATSDTSPRPDATSPPDDASPLPSEAILG